VFDNAIDQKMIIKTDKWSNNNLRIKLGIQLNVYDCNNLYNWVNYLWHSLKQFCFKTKSKISLIVHVDTVDDNKEEKKEVRDR